MVTINVVKGTATITWLTPADITYGTALGATQLNATATVPGTFVYTPASSAILNAGAAQTLSVTFTPTDAANYTSTTRTVAINVVKGTSTITWATPADIAYGTALGGTQLNATATVPGTFVYTPASGAILNAGTAQTLSVTFTPTDAANYTSTTRTVAINVVKGTSTITWPTPANITYGTALGGTQLNATATVPGTFAYTPASGAILNAGAAQTLLVTFTPTDAANYTSTTKTVAINVVKGTSTITWPTPADITYGTALGATELNATSNVQGTFVYIPAAGVVLDAGTHALAVTFTPTDANYTSTTKTVSLDVLKATAVITWATPANTTYGTALGTTQLNATATVPGTFVYTPAAGVVLGAGTHPLSVTFTPFDANYTATTKTVSLDVLKATAVVTWATPADVTYGTALGATQLNATATVPGTFAYTPASGAILNAGTAQTLSVTFTPPAAANYPPTTRTVAINVVKGTSTITWPTPANITYGTALGGTQLNATATIPGTFAYTPASGAILNAGAAQTLSVTFTPTDAVNYTSTTKT